ncbi:MAG: hypothetical protein KJ015_10350 [Myxococcales bacterium]|nr:hypothetical protein [Myxococcales bacterium]
MGRFFIPVALGASAVCSSDLAVANSGVAAISANDYSYVVGDHSFDTTCNAEATGFYNTLTNGPYFSPAVRLYDITATDRSMCDPNAPGGSANDYDTSAFDQSNLAASFVCLPTVVEEALGIGADIASGAFSQKTGVQDAGTVIVHHTIGMGAKLTFIACFQVHPSSLGANRCYGASGSVVDLDAALGGP